MDGAAGAEVQRVRADWRPYGIFPRAFSRHRCVPRENKTILGILATRASRNGVERLEVIAQTQLKLKSLRSNRRAQANRQQFDRKNETGKKNSKILRFSSVNFDRFHREKTNFRASLALTSPIGITNLAFSRRHHTVAAPFARRRSTPFVRLQPPPSLTSGCSAARRRSSRT